MREVVGCSGAKFCNVGDCHCSLHLPHGELVEPRTAALPSGQEGGCQTLSAHFDRVLAGRKITEVWKTTSPRSPSDQLPAVFSGVAFRPACGRRQRDPRTGQLVQPWRPKALIAAHPFPRRELRGLAFWIRCEMGIGTGIYRPGQRRIGHGRRGRIGAGTRPAMRMAPTEKRIMFLTEMFIMCPDCEKRFHHCRNNCTLEG